MPKIETTFGTYEEAIRKTEVPDKASSFVVYQFGLAGEIGELLTEFKKDKRGDVGDVEHQTAVCNELGDCLWYLAQMCKLRESSLHQIASHDSFVCLDVIQREVASETLSDLASELVVCNGKLAEKLKDDGDVNAILADILMCLGAIASKFSLSLSQVAERNMEKTKMRFGKDYSHLCLLDERFPDFEQLPRKLKVEIRQERVGQASKAMLFINGFMYGNPLDDNISGEEDYFRYHDIFHMSFVAHLWWSPSFRALLNKKRRSDPKVDKNEDGGRARLLEEGLVHLIFRYGRDNNFFDGKTNVRVTSSILNAIEAMVKGYEVQDRPLSLWNDAIINAFKVFLEVKKNGGGVLTIDMKNRKLRYKKQ